MHISTILPILALVPPALSAALSPARVAYRCESDWTQRCNGLFPLRDDDGKVVGSLAYFGTHSLTGERTTGKATVERALIFVHTKEQNAHSMYRLAITSAIASSYTRENTLIIAPKFLCKTTSSDHSTCYSESGATTWPTKWADGTAYTRESVERKFDPYPEDEIHFGAYGKGEERGVVDWGSKKGNAEFWIAGGLGKREGRRVGVYSYRAFPAAIDQIIESLTTHGQYPNLKEITIAGFSAGAQFAQRYASFGLYGSSTPNGKSQVQIRYVISAPRSYIYPTAERPRDISASCPCDSKECTVTASDFAVPGDGDNCDGKYDDYKYGYQKLVSPTRHYPAHNIALTLSKRDNHQYHKQDVSYLVGKRDDKHTGNCQEKVQGGSHRQRAHYMQAYVKLQYPEAKHSICELDCSHDLECVFGVGEQHGWCRLWGSC
ncbi:hypothetical protein HDV00_006026 [Rhizophlyctis rosea]|nr:hypothetical protein HDV00_006026 [Rhizophlyctis rosea]